MTEERVNRLEEQVQHLEEKRLEAIEDEIKKLNEQVAAVIQSQHERDKQMERYSARWGTLLMVGSAMVAAVKLFWEDISRFFGK